MGVNKNFIDFIVDNIDEILSYQEVRNAIASHDIKKRLEEDKKKEEAAKLKQAKINLKEQKNNLKEYELRFNNGITFIIFYEDLIVNYLFTLKAKGIEPKVITQGEIIQYGGLLLSHLKENGIHAVINLDDMKIAEFYKKHSAFFKRIANEDTEIVGELSTADISKLFHIYLPYQIMPSIIDEEVRTKTEKIYKDACKRLQNKN